MKGYRFIQIAFRVFIISAMTAFTPAVCLYAQQKPQLADTTITYTLEDVGGEGAEAIAHYVQGSIKDCQVKVFGENGQSRIRYVFLKDHITVTEQQYTYKGSLESVKGPEDMKLKKTIRYTMDQQGVVAAGADEERVDVFAELLETVPLKLE